MKKFALLILFFCNITFSQDIYQGKGDVANTVVTEEKNIIGWNNTFISVETLLQKYIQIPSDSGDEKNAGEFIKAVCKENGFHIADFGTENGNYNFAASLYPLEVKKPNIIFLNHIDCVPANTDSLSVANSGKIINGEIFGRGAIDNKGASAMQLLAMLKYLNAPDVKETYNVTFLAVSCEESQCNGGIAYVIDNYLDLLNPAVVIGEGPSEITSILEGEFKHPIFAVSVAHKRAFWLHLNLEVTTSGHGSVTPLRYSNKEMVSALDRVLKKKNKAVFNDLNRNILKSLAEHKSGLEKLVLKNPKLFKPLLVPQLRKQPELFAIFSNTITLTNLENNNSTYNKIPSKVEAFLDCRLLPSTDENEFLSQLKKRLNNDAITITVTESMPRTNPSTTENIYYKNYKKAITEKNSKAVVLPILLPNVNDLGAFRAKGIPGYASIPVYLSREEVESIHNNNEHIHVSSLYDGAAIYYRFLQLMQE